MAPAKLAIGGLIDRSRSLMFFCSRGLVEGGGVIDLRRFLVGRGAGIGEGDLDFIGDGDLDLLFERERLRVRLFDLYTRLFFRRGGFSNAGSIGDGDRDRSRTP